MPLRAFHALRILLLASLALAGCAPMTQHESSPQLDSLAARLSSSNIEDMATGLAASPQVDALWKEFPDARLHAALVVDAKRPEPVRFGAALVLLGKDAEAFWRTDRPVIAQVFAAALKQNLAGWAFPWGWLWASDGDPVGTLGRVFIEIGPPAVPALKPLLDDTTRRASYVGSEEATEMAMKRYRVKDFAAFYIARILKLDLPWEPKLENRDAAIEQLRKQLPSDS